MKKVAFLLLSCAGLLGTTGSKLALVDCSTQEQVACPKSYTSLQVLAQRIMSQEYVYYPLNPDADLFASIQHRAAYSPLAQLIRIAGHLHELRAHGSINDALVLRKEVFLPEMHKNGARTDSLLALCDSMTREVYQKKLGKIRAAEKAMYQLLLRCFAQQRSLDICYELIAQRMIHAYQEGIDRDIYTKFQENKRQWHRVSCFETVARECVDQSELIDYFISSVSLTTCKNVCSFLDTGILP